MKIKELLTDESKWTQNAFGRDAEGLACFSGDPDAVCWCLLGAMTVCYPNSYIRAEIIRKIHKHLLNNTVFNFNDAPERTFEDIKKLVNDLDI